MRKWIQLGAVVIAAALVGAITCFLVSKIHAKQGHSNPVEDHYWIHQQLHITPEQDARLEPIEKGFEEKRRRLTAQIKEGNRKLAEAISHDKSDSPSVREAIASIHNAQGELQNAVLEHVFDMKAVLTAEQYDRLLHLTAEALNHDKDSH